MADRKSWVWTTIVSILAFRCRYFVRDLDMAWTNKIFRTVSSEPVPEKPKTTGKSQSMGCSRDLESQAGVQKLRQAYDLAKVNVLVVCCKATEYQFFLATRAPQLPCTTYL